MATTLYYFSGTGNSLSIARMIEQHLEDCRIISIASFFTEQETPSSVAGDAIGIVCPIVMHNMPHIVSRFLDQISGAEYLFVVYAGGGDLGRGLVRTRRKFRNLGLILSALFNVSMPSNYTPYGYPEQSRQTEQFAAAKQAVALVAEIVRARASHFDSSGSGFVASHIFPGPLYHLGHRFIPRMDRDFVTEEHCTQCGICERVCPVGNISLQDGRPTWNHGCEQCYACLQWCPVHAIQYGSRTRGVQRYHHPGVSLSDIISAAGRE
jgi:ferredoxin